MSCASEVVCHGSSVREKERFKHYPPFPLVACSSVTGHPPSIAERSFFSAIEDVNVWRKTAICDSRCENGPPKLAIPAAVLL